MPRAAPLLRRVSIRLRPVTREEFDAYPPPWPVQPAEREVRIYSTRGARQTAGDRDKAGAKGSVVCSSSGGAWGSASRVPSPSPGSFTGTRTPLGLSPPTTPLATQALQQTRPQVTQALLPLQAEQYQSYAFATVFGPSAGSEDVYELSGCRDIVESACRGCNGTVFLYGQTGSGKTFTHEAITRAAVTTIFGRSLEDSGHELAAVVVSVVEIYCETIRCLLTGRDVTLRQAQRGGGLLLENAGEKSCASEEELLLAIDGARARRAVGETRANARSSRSHLVVRVRLEVLELEAAADSAPGGISGGAGDRAPAGQRGMGSAGAGEGPALCDGACARGVAYGTLNLVDLAGSERTEKSGSADSKPLMREALNINRSLLCLGNVVNALAERAEGKKVHVPYRDSKLTRLLEDALGGSARTALIACATPLPGFHLEQTRATLEFAARAANVVCTPQRNVTGLDALPDPRQRAAAEIERLRQALATQAAECRQLRARLCSLEGGGTAAAGAPTGAVAAARQPAKEATPSALECLKSLSLTRSNVARGASSSGSSASRGREVAAAGLEGRLGSSSLGSSEGPRSRQRSVASSGGGSAESEACAPALRRSLPSVPPTDSLIWRLLHLTSAGKGLGCLMHPFRPGSSACQAGDGDAEMLHTTGSFVPPPSWMTGSGPRQCSSCGGRAAALRRATSASVSAAVAVADTVTQQVQALLTGGTVRRATDSDCRTASSSVAGRMAANAGRGSGGGHDDMASELFGAKAFADVQRESLRDHIMRCLVGLLQQRKSEARALRDQVARLSGMLSAAWAEAQNKEARLAALVEGISRLGAARQEEFACWAAHLEGLEAALVVAQREAEAYRAEAHRLTAALAAVMSRTSAQAEQRRRTSHALLAASLEVGGALGVAACASVLAGIHAAIEAIVKDVAAGDAHEKLHDAGKATLGVQDLAAMLRELLQRVGQLLEQQHEHAGLASRPQAMLGGAVQSCDGGAAPAPDTPCPKCESTRPLMAYTQKLHAEVQLLRTAVAARDKAIASGAEDAADLRSELDGARTRAAELEERLAAAHTQLSCDSDVGADGSYTAGHACAGAWWLGSPSGMGPEAPLEQLHFWILQSWAALAVPHSMRAATVANLSWGSQAGCQAHAALLSRLHHQQLGLELEGAPGHAWGAAVTPSEEVHAINAGLVAMPARELEAACRACGIQASSPDSRRRQLLERLWLAENPAGASHTAAASAVAVAAALRHAPADAVCAAQQRSTGAFIAAVSAALREAARA